MTYSARSLAERAAQVMRANWRGRFTVPSSRLYPHQWAWDSAFAAIGWAHLDPERAVLELETLAGGAWRDGRIPHIRFHDENAEYFPGPALWGTAGSSTISQPPVWATAARRVLELGGDRARIRALLPAFERSHRWYVRVRDPLGKGLVAVTHPWESGLDNSPAWDAPLRAVDSEAAPAFRRVDLDRVDDTGQRPGDTEYKRYVVLVREIAEGGFGSSSFLVYDPAMTALLVRAERDLSWLARELGGIETEASTRAERLRAGLLEHLWDEERGRFAYYDVAAAAPVCPDVLSAYVPLIVDLPAEIRDACLGRLESEYWTRYPLPSTAPSDPAFEPRRYWRGPTWMNINWLLSPVLGEDLVERSLGLLAREGFREYFHPETGEGLGAKDFTWSAALALDWLASRAGRAR